MSRTTVTENHSSQNGAGIYVHDGLVVLRANNATITENSCDLTFTGCGIYVGTGSASITNTVLARNFQGSKLVNTPDDCNAVTSEDYNLIQTTAGCTIAGTTSNNIYDTDPNVGPLRDDGGPTQTVALLTGSPAIDAGNPSGCPRVNNPTFLLTSDQRGSVRPGQRTLRHGSLRIRAAGSVPHSDSLSGRRHAQHRCAGACRRLRSRPHACREMPHSVGG